MWTLLSCCSDISHPFITETTSSDAVVAGWPCYSNGNQGDVSSWQASLPAAGLVNGFTLGKHEVV